MAAKKPTTKKPTTKRIKPIVEEEPKDKEPVSDIEVIGDDTMFQLLSKVTSKKAGLQRMTSAMQVRGGCIINVTTQQRNPDGSYAIADALTFVPNVWIVDDVNGGRKPTQPKK